ncbi:unnamed protein product [Candida verbasci]|uniref:Uncharacterized protein n=1 Tax=Candida verbasci TaxID=1227364 RepID=A0A9W4XMC3_9ASCO|nr:unnamed protein product [Candida verbasci]
MNNQTNTTICTISTNNSYTCQDPETQDLIEFEPNLDLAGLNETESQLAVSKLYLNSNNVTIYENETEGNENKTEGNYYYAEYKGWHLYARGFTLNIFGTEIKSFAHLKEYLRELVVLAANYKKPRQVCDITDKENNCIRWLHYYSYNLPNGASADFNNFSSKCYQRGFKVTMVEPFAHLKEYLRELVVFAANYKKPRQVCDITDKENNCIRWSHYYSYNLPNGTSADFNNFSSKCYQRGFKVTMVEPFDDYDKTSYVCSIRKY